MAIIHFAPTALRKLNMPMEALLTLVDTPPETTISSLGELTTRTETWPPPGTCPNLTARYSIRKIQKAL
jgi:hypothetical protein